MTRVRKINVQPKVTLYPPQMVDIILEISL